MRLYLVQHGQAKSEELDPQRGLTEQGVQDVERLAAFLKPLSLAVQVVWHSGKTRAAQTAEILAPSDLRVMSTRRSWVRNALFLALPGWR